MAGSSFHAASTRQAIHRGTDTSVKDLNAKIRTFIDAWNDRAHHFVWTKAADDILKKANRKTASDTGHEEEGSPAMSVP